MMMRFPCVIVLVAFCAMSSVQSQDIEPQPIPIPDRPSTTEGPYVGVTVTNDNSESISTTTETFETSEMITSTESVSTTEPASTLTTIGEIVETTTAVIGEATTTVPTTEAIDITTEAVTTTTSVLPTKAPTIPSTTEAVPTSRPKPAARPDAGGSMSCRILLREGKPYYNWILRVLIIPRTCSYCCVCKGIRYCADISPFFCNLKF